MRANRSPFPRVRHEEDPVDVRCGGLCGGPAVREVLRQWKGGTWYDVEQVRCLNRKPIEVERRKALRLERGLGRSAHVQCGWHVEVSRVERSDLAPFSIAPSTHGREWQGKTLPATLPTMASLPARREQPAQTIRPIFPAQGRQPTTHSQ